MTCMVKRRQIRAYHANRIIACMLGELRNLTPSKDSKRYNAQFSNLSATAKRRTRKNMVAVAHWATARMVNRRQTFDSKFSDLK